MAIFTDKYKFKDNMYTDPNYAPYYSKYKGHYFRISDVPHPGHCEIYCVSDSLLEVDGIVHIEDMEKV